MNKIVVGFKAICHGFMPVSRIKLTLTVLVLSYAIFLVFQLREDFCITRRVLIENKTLGGNVVLNGIKHPVPYTIVKTRVKFDVGDPLDFLFLPNGDYNESFITALTKLITCILALRLLLIIDVEDPYRSRYYKDALLLTYLVLLVIMTSFFEALFQANWTGGVLNGLSDFRMINDFSPFFYIGLSWVLKAVFTFYKKAVEARREAELTI